MSFLIKYKFHILTFIVGIILSYYLFKCNIEETTTTTTTIEVIKHDTVTVEKIVPIETIKYITVIDTAFINNIDTNQVDSLYQQFAEQVKNGNIPYAENETYFGKHYLKTKYTFPPLSKFDYIFKAGDDSIITNTTTITKIVDKTPKLSFYLGATSQLNSSDGSLNNFGLLLGAKYKRLGIQTNIYQRSKNFGIAYYWPK